MGKQNQDYATMGLKALSRAAQKAIAEAKRKNLKIPIWKDGKIEYINPEINTESGKGGVFPRPPHTTQRAGPH